MDRLRFIRSLVFFPAFGLIAACSNGQLESVSESKDSKPPKPATEARNANQIELDKKSREEVEHLTSSAATERFELFAMRDPKQRARILEAQGGTDVTEAAVARALDFLAKNQNEDGGWGRGLGRSDVAGTSLALLPFLGAGESHQSGEHEVAVERGLLWLVDQQAKNGDLRNKLSKSNTGMYAHAIGALVLCESYALTEDKKLRDPTQKAIDFIVSAQHEAGGWRYHPGMPGDTSVSGWQIAALYSAGGANLTVPDSTFMAASKFLDSVQADGGAKYAYHPGTASNASMCAEGLMSRIYCGWTKENPALQEGLELLLASHMPSYPDMDIYYLYHGTQLAFQLGGKSWDRWNARMREVLVKSQITNGRYAGAWRPMYAQHAQRDDWIYTTSLAACTLEVYYRHAPLFHRAEPKR